MGTGCFADRVHLLCIREWSDQRANLHVLAGLQQVGIVWTVSQHEHFTYVVAGWFAGNVLVFDAGESGIVRDRLQREPAEAADVYDAGSEHFPSVESEDRAIGCVCERSWRRAATLYDECGRYGCTETGTSGHGIRD